MYVCMYVCMCMCVLYVCVYVIRFSWQPFIWSTSHLAGLLPRTEGSVMSSVKLFGWMVLEKAASNQPLLNRHRMGRRTVLAGVLPRTQGSAVLWSCLSERFSKKQHPISNPHQTLRSNQCSQTPTCKKYLTSFKSLFKTHFYRLAFMWRRLLHLFIIIIIFLFQLYLGLSFVWPFWSAFCYIVFWVTCFCFVKALFKLCFWIKLLLLLYHQDWHNDL